MSAKYSVNPSRLALAITATLAAGQVSAATITVDTLADPGTAGECSLRSAIDAVETQAAVYGCDPGDGINDTITFAAGLTGSIQLTAGELDIGSDVTIAGPGPGSLSIDAAQASRVVHVQSYATVSISGLTLEGGAADYGAGAYVTDGYLTLQACVLDGNVAAGFGGGVELFGGSLYVDNCSFSNNEAGERGGGIAVTSGSAEVFDSNIVGNEASFGGGAQVSPLSSYGGPGPQRPGRGEPGDQEATLLVSSSVISGNFAIIGGGLGAGADGGIVPDSDLTPNGGPPPPGGQNLTIVNSYISGNQAYSGGGIGIAAPAGQIPNGIPSASNAVNITGSTITGNTAYTGGGIGATGGALTLEYTVIISNQAYFGGGGISMYGSGPGGPGPQGSFDPSSRWTEASEPSGGYGPNSGLRVGLSSIGGNQASYGGGVVIRGVESEFFGTQIINNQGGGIQVNNALSEVFASQVSDNGSSDVGGLDCRNDSFCYVTYSSVTGNAGYSVGGIQSQSGQGPQAAPQGYLTPLFVFSSTVSGNQGSFVGGIYAPSAYIIHSSVVQNEQTGLEARGIATGGVLVGDASQFSHSLIAENLAGAGASDVRSFGMSPLQVNYSLIGDSTGLNYAGTGNVLDVDPLIGPLDANGASYSLSHALLAGSPAIDAGDPALKNVPSYDQRGPGFDRVVGGVIDIGALEADGAPAEPDVGLSVSSIDFSGLLIGLNDSAPLTITSTGTGSLDLGQLNVSATRGGIFGLANDTCSNQSLAPSASCTVDVTFQPPALGAFSGALIISSNAPSSPDLVPVSGVGVAPVLNLTSSTVDFGTVSVGATGLGSTTVRNTGTAPLTFSATDTALPFSVSAGAGLCLDGGATVLAANESCTLSFSFDPTIEGPASQLVNLTSDSFGGDSSVQLSGNAVVGPAPAGPTVAVPFMGKVGNVMLAMSLMLLGLLGLRGRFS